MAIPVSIRVYHDTGDVSSDSAAAQAGCTAACTSYYTGTTIYTGGHDKPYSTDGTTSVTYTNYQLTATAVPGWYLKGWDVVYRAYVTGGYASLGSDEPRTDTEIQIKRSFVSGPSPYPLGTSAVTLDWPSDFEEADPSYNIYTRHTYKREIVAVYAQFAQGDAPTPDPSAYYKVTTNSNPSTFGTTDGDGDYARDSTCTITATPATHSSPYARYEFDYWEINGARVQGAGATYTFTVTAHMTCVAHFVEKWRVWIFRYPVTDSSVRIELNGERDDGDSGPDVEQWLLAGQTITLKAVGSSKYDTAEWYRLASSDPLSGGTKVQSTHTLSYDYTYVTSVVAGYNVYRADFRYSWVTFVASAAGQYISSQVTISIDGNSDPSRPWTYTRERPATGGWGWGWYVSLSASKKGATYYSYRFLYWTDTPQSDGWSDVPESANVLSRNCDYSVGVDSSMKGATLYYYAVYGECTNIKSNVSPDGGGSITYSRDPDSPADSAGDHWYLNGTSVSLTATPSSGYTFAFWAWTESGKTKKSYNATYSFNSVDGDEWELTAYFTPDGVPGYGVIETAVRGSGTASGDGIYLIGATCTITATPPATTYVFDHWELGGDEVQGAEASYSFVVSGDAKYTAVFVTKIYQVTTAIHPSFEEAGVAAGTISGAEAGSVYVGTTVDLRIREYNGFVFKYLKVNGEIVQVGTLYSIYYTYSFVVTCDTLCEAFFAWPPGGQLIYDDATGRLICADSGQLIYHDRVLPSH